MRNQTILEVIANNCFSRNITKVNPDCIKPIFEKGEPEKRLIDGVWVGGYKFDRFLGNCYELLGDLSKVDGMQQLIHCYYLNNGELNAYDTVYRIKNLLKFTEELAGL